MWSFYTAICTRRPSVDFLMNSQREREREKRRDEIESINWMGRPRPME